MLFSGSVRAKGVRPTAVLFLCVGGDTVGQGQEHAPSVPSRLKSARGSPKGYLFIYVPCALSQFEIRWPLVRVISEKPLREFAKKYPDAATPLAGWQKLVQHGHFRNLTELKQTFNSVDMVPVKGRDLYVFNIGGNKYRLIVAIHFNTQRLFARYVLTHSEYNSGKWEK